MNKKAVPPARPPPTGLDGALDAHGRAPPHPCPAGPHHLQADAGQASPRCGDQIALAALADIHACEPWMTVSRSARSWAETNALEPDLIVLLGDYVCAIYGWQRVVTDA